MSSDSGDDKADNGTDDGRPIYENVSRAVYSGRVLSLFSPGMRDSHGSNDSCRDTNRSEDRVEKVSSSPWNNNGSVFTFFSHGQDNCNDNRPISQKVSCLYNGVFLPSHGDKDNTNIQHLNESTEQDLEVPTSSNNEATPREDDWLRSPGAIEVTGLGRVVDHSSQTSTNRGDGQDREREHRQGSSSDVTDTPLVAAELVDERELEEEIRQRILSHAIQANEVTNVDDDNDSNHLNQISRRSISLLGTILIICAIVGVVVGIVLRAEIAYLASTVPPDPGPTPMPWQTPPTVTPTTTTPTTTPKLAPTMAPTGPFSWKYIETFNGTTVSGFTVRFGGAVDINKTKDDTEIVVAVGLRIDLIPTLRVMWMSCGSR